MNIPDFPLVARRHPARGVKLHIGCFDQPLDGWLNTDVTMHLWVARVPLLAELLGRTGHMAPERLVQHRAGVFDRIRFLNVGRRFPLEDNSVEAVYSSHMLEHLGYDVARHCLSECHRVLAPGAVVRIAVPDLDRMIEEYDADKADEWVYAAFESRQQRDRNRHKWMYNELTLSKALEHVGFEDVYRCEFQQGKCPDLERLDNRPRSLFMEAVK